MPRITRLSTYGTPISKLPAGSGSTQIKQIDSELPPRRGARDQIVGQASWSITIPAYPVAKKQIDADLPPLGRGPTIDLRTSYQSGSHGAKVGTQSADLTPLGRGASIDLGTAILPGRHAAAAAEIKQIDSELPPRRGARDLIVGEASFGIVIPPYPPVGQRGAISSDLPPPGTPRFHQDLLSSSVGGYIGDPIAPQPQWSYDSSLPPFGDRWVTDTRTSIIQGRNGAKAQTQNDDSLPVRSRQSAIDIGTSFLAGQVTVTPTAGFYQLDSSLPPRAGSRDPMVGQASWSIVIPPYPVAGFYQTDSSLPPPGPAHLAPDNLTSYSAGNPLVPSAGVLVHAQKFRGDVGSLMTH